MGKAYYSLKNYDKAYSMLGEVAENLKTKEGAESRYLQCDILFIQKKYKEAEDLILDLAEKNSPHQYWLARSFILLSDIYVLKEDNFQAMHTLQSILDYYETPDDGIITLAKDRKSRILEMEVNQYSQEEEDIEISIDDEN